MIKQSLALFLLLLVTACASTRDTITYEPLGDTQPALPAHQAESLCDTQVEAQVEQALVDYDAGVAIMQIGCMNPAVAQVACSSGQVAHDAGSSSKRRQYEHETYRDLMKDCMLWQGYISVVQKPAH